MDYDKSKYKSWLQQKYAHGWSGNPSKGETEEYSSSEEENKMGKIKPLSQKKRMIQFYCNFICTYKKIFPFSMKETKVQKPQSQNYLISKK